MASRKRGGSQKAKKIVKKTKPSKPAKTAKAKKKLERARPPVVSSKLPEPTVASKPEIRERYVITLENIRGDTAIGDLIVTFPRTREVLARKGLRLEAEDAGDIYMTLDVFSAMNGLETANLVQEIVEVAREPITLPLQVVSPPVP